MMILRVGCQQGRGGLLGRRALAGRRRRAHVGAVLGGGAVSPHSLSPSAPPSFLRPLACVYDVPSRRCLSTDAAAAAAMEDDGDDRHTIRMADYTYTLDPSSIAVYPASPRGSSKLLQVDADGTVTHHPRFDEAFPGLVKDKGHVVFNESRVLNARLSVVRSDTGETGGGESPTMEMMILDAGEIGPNVPCVGSELEVMLRRVGVNVGDTFEEATTGSATFEVVRSMGLWEEDEKSQGNGTECVVRVVEARDSSILTLGDLLDVCGTVPIPPYLNRDAEESDAECYNNVYAADHTNSDDEREAAADGGSVAAPTAGLHFTDAVLRNIGPRNTSYLSLHVGAGTFKPVVAENARDHVMHAERFRVNVGEIRRIVEAMNGGKEMVVVGTTSSRTLESLYWCGVRKIRGLDRQESRNASNGGGSSTILSLGQEEWIPLLEDGMSEGISAPEALLSLVDDDSGGKSDDEFLEGSTSLMIVPGRYHFQVVDRLVTNFHAPDSTLMLLVSAFLGSGRKVRSVYEEAADRGYKFLSYGDACVFSRPR